MPALLAALILAQAPTRLPETVVVETRHPAPLEEASPSVSRVIVAEATDSGLTTLAGALATTPGLYATEQTGEGSQASAFIRGTNSSQSALLLDGRRLPPGFSGSYEMGRYRLFGLRSVEILRGPSSSLYGANALGGVVDLRLADPLTDAVGGVWQVEGGSYGRATAGFAWLTNDAKGRTAARTGTSVALTSTHDDGWRVNGARDATNALVKSAWRLSPHLVLELIGSADLAKAGLPGQSATVPAAGDPNDWQKDSGWMLSPGLRFEDDRVSAVAFWSRGGSAVTSLVDGTNFFGPFAYHQRFLLDRDELTAFADWKLRPDLTLGVGATYERTDFDQLALDGLSTTWSDTHETLGVWTRADWRASATDRFRAAWRRNEHTDFAGKTTAEFSYARRLGKELVAEAKIASAYRAPAANDLAYGTSGNRALRPESNTGGEIGLRYESRIPGEFSVTLAVFRNELTDLIDYDPADFYKTFNIAKARTQGIELGAAGRPIQGLRLFGAATLLDTEVLSPDYQGVAAAGQALLRRPRLTLNAGAEVAPNDDWTFGAAVTLLRGRVDYDWNLGQRVDLADAATVRLWVRYALDARGELSLRVENLFGEDAPPAGIGFGAQPRSVYVGYTRRF
jgi:vitamin B12 transporter